MSEGRDKILTCKRPVTHENRVSSGIALCAIVAISTSGRASVGQAVVDRAVEPKSIRQRGGAWRSLPPTVQLAVNVPTVTVTGLLQLASGAACHGEREAQAARDCVKRRT